MNTAASVHFIIFCVHSTRRATPKSLLVEYSQFVGLTDNIHKTKVAT